ncbi:hypothetical protein JCM6882_000791 [Rhodosporidiobolus microsporus]
MTAEGISATAYAHNVRRLIGVLNELRSAGASTELDLPRIATIGSQSSGKSSLMEAISGVGVPAFPSSSPKLTPSPLVPPTFSQVKVPRDPGTCTRCPMEVRLRFSKEPWTCRIFLRFETGIDGKPLETVSETAFGQALTDPNAVEAALRRAQLAVLNPSVENKEYFLEMDDATVKAAKEGTKPPLSEEQLSFSTNLVCLDISGPSIVDLAFVDLPGIISNSPSPAEIELVKKMTVDAIKGNALILLAVTMRDDYQNQKAVLLAQQADPEGKRTIGVLTKADLVQEGEFSGWLDMLEGRKNQLANGFFVTKQPAPADLQKNLTFLDARAAEVEFFKSTAPWNNLKLASKERLGIANLTKFLSERLAEYIAEKLPSIHAQVADSLVFLNTSIQNLPPPPAVDLVAELHIHLADLRSNLQSLVNGSSGDLVREKNRSDKQYKQVIRATRPAFVPFDSKDAGRLRKWESDHKPAAKRRKGNEQQTVPPAAAPVVARPAAPPTPTLAPATPKPFTFTPDPASPFFAGSSTLDLSGRTPPVGVIGGRTPAVATVSSVGGGRTSAVTPSTSPPRPPVSSAPAKPAPPPAAALPPVTQASTARADSDDEDDEGVDPAPSLHLRLDEVRKHIEEHKARELPLNTPYGARASLMVEALADWPGLTIEAAEKLRKPLTISVEKLVATYFRNSELRGMASMATAEVLDELFSAASTRLKDHLELDSVPFTQNSHYFQTTRDETMIEYKEARQPTSLKNASSEKLEDVFTALAAIGFKGLDVEDLSRLHKPDEWEEELEAMAQTVAYWKVAYKRIIDDVPRILDHAVIRPLPAKLGSALVAKLTSGGDSEIKRLMAESPAIAEERAELNSKRTKLEAARKVLLAFGSEL